MICLIKDMIHPVARELFWVLKAQGSPIVGSGYLDCHEYKLKSQTEEHVITKLCR
jgi:hypothetical protein